MLYQFDHNAFYNYVKRKIEEELRNPDAFDLKKVAYVGEAVKSVSQKILGTPVTEETKRQIALELFEEKIKENKTLNTIQALFAQGYGMDTLYAELTAYAHRTSDRALQERIEEIWDRLARLPLQ